jgi:hypothetical protein
MNDATAFFDTLATVRQTNATHASALDALERAFDAETVTKNRALAVYQESRDSSLFGEE